MISEEIYKSKFYINEQNGVPLLKCLGIPFPHGFSTRLGGVSCEAGYESLDLGARGEDDEISENRRRFVLAIGSEKGSLIFAKQIHSSDVQYVTEEDFGKSFECDAFVTDRAGVLIAVKTADCVPILFCDSKKRIVGAAHAGWRGTASGVAARCLEKMISLGASSENVSVAIGQRIGVCCYEVDDAFVEAVSDSPFASLCLSKIFPVGEKFRADLGNMNKEILLSLGVKEENIYLSGFCTSCANELFFSHRRGGGRRGLMMSGIFIPKRI